MFHLFNSFFLKIGIFPYFALSFAIFFYPPETIRAVFFKQKPKISELEFISTGKSYFFWIFIPYFLIQLILPLRHWFIKGDVLWTEEGHRLSWRMMLRERKGTVRFRVVDTKSGEQLLFPINKHLTRRQIDEMATKPDMIWQMAQYIKSDYAKHEIEVAVYADCCVSVNGKLSGILIDPNVNLATAQWDYFWHNQWIVLPKTN
jgi:hypothetical protein